MLNDVIGMPLLKERVLIDIKACKKRNIRFPHTLLYGIGGCGKTFFARAIADELGAFFVQCEGSSLKDRDMINDFIEDSTHKARNAQKRLCIFIDEVHQLSSKMQEVWYYPMVESKIIRVLESGGQAITSFTPFTVIAATSRPDMLDQGAFVTRFDNKWEIDRYDEYQLQVILSNYFRKHQIRCGNQFLKEIAKRSLGIPRNAVSLAKKVHNHVVARHKGMVVTPHDLSETFRLEEIDDVGLSKLHRRYLDRLAISDGPVGLKTLSIALGQREDFLSGEIEKILVILGMVNILSKGRQLTAKGLEYIRPSSVA